MVEAQNAGAVTMNIGVFINTLINFLIVAFAVFFLVRSINSLKREEEEAPTTKECPHCFSTISIKATRCAHCTTELKSAPEEA